MTNKREQAFITRASAYHRCFETVAGKRVLADLKTIMPNKISGKDPYETTRNAAVRDLLDYIEARISEGKDPNEIPPQFDSKKATLREA